LRKRQGTPELDATDGNALEESVDDF